MRAVILMLCIVALVVAFGVERQRVVKQPGSYSVVVIGGGGDGSSR